jgi:hypothetical protein
MFHDIIAANRVAGFCAPVSDISNLPFRQQPDFVSLRSGYQKLLSSDIGVDNLAQEV